MIRVLVSILGEKAGLILSLAFIASLKLLWWLFGCLLYDEMKGMWNKISENFTKVKQPISSSNSETETVMNSQPDNSSDPPSEKEIIEKMNSQLNLSNFLILPKEERTICKNMAQSFVVTQIFCPFKLNIRRMVQILQFLWVLAYQPIATLVTGANTNNKFIIELQNQDDVQRALSYSPSLYDAWLLVAKAYQFAIPPALIITSKANFWVGYVNLAVEFWGQGIPERIANRIGRFIEKQLPQDNHYSRPYIRCLVEMDLNKRMDETFTLFHEENDWIDINLLYEPLPRSFCRICRIINHSIHRCREKSPDFFSPIYHEPLHEEVANMAHDYDQMEQIPQQRQSPNIAEEVFEFDELLTPSSRVPQNLPAPAYPPGFSIRVTDMDFETSVVNTKESEVTFINNCTSKRLWIETGDMGVNKVQRWNLPGEINANDEGAYQYIHGPPHETNEMREMGNSGTLIQENPWDHRIEGKLTLTANSNLYFSEHMVPEVVPVSESESAIVGKNKLEIQIDKEIRLRGKGKGKQKLTAEEEFIEEKRKKIQRKKKETGGERLNMPKKPKQSGTTSFETQAE